MVIYLLFLLKYFFLIYQITQITHKFYFQIYSLSPLNTLKKNNTLTCSKRGLKDKVKSTSFERKRK